MKKKDPVTRLFRRLKSGEPKEVPGEHGGGQCTVAQLRVSEAQESGPWIAKVKKDGQLCLAVFKTYSAAIVCSGRDLLFQITFDQKKGKVSLDKNAKRNRELNDVRDTIRKCLAACGVGQRVVRQI